jgi:hypothetical protein
MKRRQFLKAIPAVAVAAAIPASYATGGVVDVTGSLTCYFQTSGTETGRLALKQLDFARMYGMGVSRMNALGNVIDIPNIDFCDLEARVLSRL